MKRVFLIILVQFLVAFVAVAQVDTNLQTVTTFPENGKFEIITRSLTMRDTFMLNRENGDTWQLVSTSYGYTWEKLYRNSNSLDKIPAGYKGAVYQITMSGIAAKGIYLTNTLTGASWCLFSDSKTGELFWGSLGSPE